MSDLGKYLAGFRSRTAETRRATIVRKLASGDYTCSLDDTGGSVTASRGNIAFDLGIGQKVVLLRTEGSLRGGNDGYVIANYPNPNDRNASTSAPYTVMESKPGETISKIPAFVGLTRGGAAVPVLIYGTGLVTTPIYGDSGITNDVAPVITATLITLQVKASGGMAVGRYSITVAGQTIPNFFEVT